MDAEANRRRSVDSEGDHRPSVDAEGDFGLSVDSVVSGDQGSNQTSEHNG